MARSERGEVIGIGPLVIGRGEGVGRRRLRHLTFLGAIGESTGECEDFMVLPGMETEVIGCFAGIIFGDLAAQVLDKWYPPMATRFTF